VIFVTVGTQLPFNRLIDAVEAYAATNPQEEIVAQTGEGAADGRWPHLTLVQRLTPEGFAEQVKNARLIVAHAGIGTILSAKQYRRPVVLVPRRHDLGEHRNDHQMATARQMDGRTGLHVCWDVTELGQFMSKDSLSAAGDTRAPQTSDLIAHLRTLMSK
jgi:UDP-N-acetylglucosamine transferase subunit ALG13